VWREALHRSTEISTLGCWTGARDGGSDAPEDSSWTFSLEVPVVESHAATAFVGGADCSSLAVWVRWIVGRIMS
jgi:hypothetical protein